MEDGVGVRVGLGVAVGVGVGFGVGLAAVIDSVWLVVRRVKRFAEIATNPVAEPLK